MPDYERLRVLYIDDNVGMSHSITGILQEMGIDQINHQRSSRDAVDRVVDDLADNFDLIICRAVMAKVSGLQVLRTVRQFDPKIPFLMLATQPDRETVLMAKKYGVSSFVTMPAQAADIRTQITAALARSYPEL